MATRQRRSAICAGLLFFVGAALLPSIAAAQGQTGIIGGAVRDNSGGVLPGVTVEASSPALIEKQRTVVTDSQGLYRIIDLRPGVYTVTFTLPGFTTLRREGIEVSAGFAATINAELNVGSLEETVTVTGQSPLVDVQSTTQHRTVSSDVIAELPTVKSWMVLGALIPGVTLNQPQSQDVGGQGDRNSLSLRIHGSQESDLPLAFDGMRYISPNAGTPGIWQANAAMVQEISFDTSGAGAEYETSGVRVNTIPKQGGNLFSGYFVSNFANGAMEWNNLDAKLKARGVSSATESDKVWDVNPAFGGPIKQDKVWFYFGYRYHGYNTYPPGVFQDSDPADFVFTPDPRRKSLNRTWNHSTAVRFTAQTTANSKLAAYGDYGPRCWCSPSLSTTTAFEASTRLKADKNSLFQATWNWVASPRLLIEVGQTLRLEDWTFALQEGVPADRTGVRDTGTGITFRAPLTSQRSHNTNNNGKLTVSYVTGSHSFKTGTQWFWGPYDRTVFAPNNLNYTVLNGIPTSITLHAKPATGKQRLKMNLGTFAQDQWVIQHRLTLNLGARLDYLNGYLPAQDVPTTQYAAARHFAGQKDVPNWTDLSPRLGASYDVFGTGKTALKWSLGRYMKGEGGGLTREVNPITTDQNTATNRAWTDSNGNFTPDCVLTDPVANGECGPFDNLNFGATGIAVRYDPEAVTGWGTRTWNWEMAAGVQHQLLSGLSAEVSYNRRWWGNQRVTDNLLVTPGDYDPYCVTAPVDSRLPNGGGYQVCGLFDIKPSKFGQSFNEFTLAKKFGTQTEVYDGVDVVANLRLPWIQLQGGTSTGRSRINTCLVVDSPQQLLNCDIRPPMLTQAKASAIYNLPWWDVHTSLTFQSVPGPEILANWSVPTAQIAPSLGRNLAGGARSATVPLAKSGTLYGERMNQLDLRVAKYFKQGRSRFGVLADLYNLFNANPVLTQNNTYGANWRVPTAVLSGRLAKFGFQLDF